MSIKINFSKKEDFVIGLEVVNVNVKNHYPFTGDMENHECDLEELTVWSKSVLQEELRDLLDEVLYKIKDLIKEGALSGSEDDFLYVLSEESKGTVELELDYKWSASNYFTVDQRGRFDITTTEEVELAKLAYIDTEVLASMSKEEATANGLLIDEVLAEQEAFDGIKDQFDEGKETSGSVMVECCGVSYNVSWEVNEIEDVV